MKCPQCGQEMLVGFLQAGNRMAFNKHIHKLSLYPKNEQDVLIANNIVNGCNFSGFVCNDCKLITFDYSNPQAQED